MVGSEECGIRYFIFPEHDQVSAFIIIYPVNAWRNVSGSCYFRKYQGPVRTHYIHLRKSSVFLFPDSLVPVTFNANGRAFFTGFSMEGFIIRELSVRKAGSAVRGEIVVDISDLGRSGYPPVPFMQMVWKI